MSAFILSSDHLNGLISYGFQAKLLDNWSKKRWFQELAQENINSFNYRYSEKNTIETLGLRYKFNSKFLELKNLEIAVLKMCDCYQHQSCEHPEWRDSNSFKFIERIRDYAISELPGYEEAPWEYYK